MGSSHVWLKCVLLAVVFVTRSRCADCSSSLRRLRNRTDLKNEEIYFIIHQETPFVIMDPVMTSVQDEEPFLCRHRRRKYPGVGGIFFDAVDEFEPTRNQWCICIGSSSCSREEIITFVGQTKEVGGPVFGVGNLVPYTENYVSETTVITVALVNYRMQVVGIGYAGNQLFSAWNTFRSAYTERAWTMFVVTCVLIIMLRVVISACLGKKRIFHHISGMYDENTPSSLIWLNSVWMNGVKLFLTLLLAIFVIYYEQSLPDVPAKHLDPLKFVRYRNTIEDHFFGELFPKYILRVQVFDGTVEQCYDEILNQSSSFNYAISNDLRNKYMFSTRSGLCGKIYVLTSDLKHPSMGLGLMFSNNIPQRKLNTINQAIVRARGSGRLDQIVRKTVGPEGSTCSSPRSINMQQMYFAMFFPALVLLLVLLALIIVQIERCYVHIRGGIKKHPKSNSSAKPEKERNETADMYPPAAEINVT